MMIGETVRKLRERKGLSQAELGKMVGASQQNIAQLESNEVKQPRYLSALAKALGLSIDKLYSMAEGGDNIQPPPLHLVREDNATEYKSSQIRKDFIESYASLSEEDLDLVKDYIQFLLWKRDQR